MKIIRYRFEEENLAFIVPQGLILRHEEDFIAADLLVRVAIGDTIPVLYTGPESQKLFEALIQFLIGREQLFDVDKFLEKLNRVEGSKL